MSNKNEPDRKKIKPKVRPVFFVSNSTGITVETLGRSLLYQFSTLKFDSCSLRYIDTLDKAVEACELINKAKKKFGLRPIILSSLVKPELRAIVSKANGLYLDVFDTFISSIEKELGLEARLGMGRSHGIVNEADYSDRIESLNFSLSTDDGMGAQQYNLADVILTGVSRTGKTPTSLYLALHYGLKAANYPIVGKEIELEFLPKLLRPFKKKLFGLLLSAQRLQDIRSKRLPSSKYASIKQCQHEIRQTEAIFIQENIPYFDVTSMSVEEISSAIMSKLNISTKTFAS